MKKIAVILSVLFALLLIFGIVFMRRSQTALNQSVSEENNISYYTCGMHPEVKVSAEEYKRGSTQCPICHMDLVAVERSESGSGGQQGHNSSDTGDDFAQEVRVKAHQAQLAGVEVEPVKLRHLVKEIRTVGKVAFDPKLIVAEEEFIQAVKALEQISKSSNSEVVSRAEALVESSANNLRLMGLSDDQIKELREQKQAHKNLILPQEKMWVYAQAYEYELGYLKEGQQVLVSLPSGNGREFKGQVAAINPVLDPKTRSVTFRVLVDTPGLSLKPQMYVDVLVMVDIGEVLSVPVTAVLDTGTRKVAWIKEGTESFKQRQVETGPKAVAGAREFYPVVKGLRQGEQVVTKANFLIDSQSRLSGSASGAFGGSLDTKEQPPAHQH